jgi:hypothetical protein
VYAWAEDVKLSGPSVGLAVQSDEYGKGTVSRVASAVASTAASLKKVPFIGPFATATEMGASAVSSIAKLFGFTNVPVIADTAPYRPEPFPKLASTEIGYPVEKLTVDAKNELSIDPTIVGLKNEDELVISHLAQKESYLTTATWSSSDAADKILFSSVVSPILFDYTTNASTTQTAFYQPPMCWLTNLFQYWRGDIIFRFKVVASMFHKGRLRLSFDPSGYSSENILNDANSSNVVFTEIIDLSESNEVEFRVPFQQALPYLYTQALSSSNKGFSLSATPTFIYDPTIYNGTLCLRVLNTLTAPIATSQVSILVFVKAADNIEFGSPNDLENFTTFAVQSDAIVGTAPSVAHNDQALVNFGERVLSLRSLLRRYTLSTVDVAGQLSSNYGTVYNKLFTKLPAFYGFDPAGLYAANGLIATASSFPFNYAHCHPLHLILPAFVGYRGSTNWTFNCDLGGNPVTSQRVIRNNSTAVGGTTKITTTTTGTASTNVIANFYLGNTLSGSAGMALTNSMTNAGLNVSTPMYDNYLFQSTKPSYFAQPSTTDGAAYDSFMWEAFTNTGSSGSAPPPGMRLFQYCAIGVDFNPLFFLNVPTFYQYIGAIVPT